MQRDKVFGSSGGKEIIRIDLEDSESDSNGESFNQQSAGNENTDKNDTKLGRALKDVLQEDDKKSPSSFNPELSNREKRKLSRKFNQEGKKNTSLYDEHGILRTNGKDICDCLDEDCLGCHFPCLKCRSYKCGQDCRVNRKWMYESVENESDKTLIKNRIQIH